MQLNAFWRFSLRVLILVAVVVQSFFLVAILASFAGIDVFHEPRQPVPSTTSPQHERIESIETFYNGGLTLRHIIHHGAGQPGPRARRLDVTPQRAMHASSKGDFGPFSIRTTSMIIDKPVIWQRDTQVPISPMWLSEDVPGPNVSDKETVLNFAYMSEDAYKADPSDPEWLDVDEKWNHSIPFGWEDSGIRGQVFSDATNSTVILSVKGTTVAVFEGNGTSGHDKDNDNLFGSCCCGQGGSYLWRKVCDCQTGTYTCDQKCVKDELKKPNRYFEATLELFDEVRQLYPGAHIITTGHSLGGVLASFIGLRHGIPSVSFEAYPQALAAARLGLPTAGDISPLRRNTGGFHFGHTGDPIYMGTCNGGSSFCSIAGYAFETLCHTGKRCTYDVVKDWGWRASTSYHRLRYSIENVYSKYDTAAECEDEDVECEDCYLWKFENGTHTTTSSSSTMTSTTSTQTRTETCKTPGWFGCNDPTTTTGPTSTSDTTTTTTTSTCETPGWFGCKDKTTSDTTTTSEATTTTCTTKGWFGRCLDETPAMTTPATEANAYWRTAATATQTPS